MGRAVRFERYGDEGVLQVVDVPDPQAGPGEVLVRVVVAGTNPGEGAIRSGAMHDRFPAVFPEGQGSDLAGVVAAVGPGVAGVAVGDAVIGLSDGRDAQADLVVLPADRVVPKPDALDWAVAATLHVAGTTAVAMLRTVPAEPGATVVVAGAAGGVGVVLTQLAVGAGARVLAVAGPANHAWLRARGAEPVAHGEGLRERLEAAAPDGVAAFYDCFGGGYVDLALALGVPPERVDTIADFEAAARTGVAAAGMAALDDPAQAVRELAATAARGGLEVPVKARYPLDAVQDAYREVARRSGLGKVVLDVSAP